MFQKSIVEIRTKNFPKFLQESSNQDYFDYWGAGKGKTNPHRTVLMNTRNIRKKRREKVTIYRKKSQIT
jgi:hypothetical protein